MEDGSPVGKIRGRGIPSLPYMGEGDWRHYAPAIAGHRGGSRMSCSSLAIDEGERSRDRKRGVVRKRERNRERDGVREREGGPFVVLGVWFSHTWVVWFGGIWG